MITVDPQRTVAELVSERPGRSRVFEQVGIDYCCGGKEPLAVACAAKGVALDEIVAALAAEPAPGDDRDWRTETLEALVDNIVSTHHAYLRTELPRLNAMADKVAMVHGAHHLWLAELRDIVAELRAELDSHMMKEERILFPYIVALASGQPAFAPFGSVQGPISMMEQEHDQAGHNLARLRELSSDYTPPADACNTFRALLDGLREMELDLHLHIHKENHILFPRAVELEAAGR